MAIVVDHLLPWAAVNHCVIALDAGTFLAFVRGHGDGAKLDALDDLVRFAAQLFDKKAMKLGVFEGALEVCL
jgi:hypothetical protein